MRTSIQALSGLFLVASAAPALADDTAPPPAFTINGSATLVTDYRFRGISQTDKRFAVQGGFSVSHKSGFYASVWGSSIDDYVANGGNQEIDFIGGYKKTFSGTTVDVGVLYYYYPGSHGANTDFVEPYIAVSHTFGPATAKVTGNYAPKQRALSVGNGKEDNFYLAGDFSLAVPKTPIGVSAHIAHSFGPSYLTIGKGYTDWGLGVSYTWKALTFGVNYVDTNKSLFVPSGRNASKAGVVGSIGVAF
ncbi:MAG: hypothetical protein DI623_09255 [Sphingomonas sanxanigenens]|uniref:Porin n=1 Tax=Sphingomonas sanxanigenens TaxID=397260 RepID=A0A2W5A5J1_9SPHN|nr:MAG: hypothetical protein DI623_09255 [Sphingomonas sanxanigenens]